MLKKKIIMFLGGEWHKFEEFNKFINDLLGNKYNIESSYDFKMVHELESTGNDLVILNTCIDKEFNEKDGNINKITGTEIVQLIKLVRSGCNLLTFHSSTVLGNLDERLKKLIGGNFISHPESGPVTVIPVFKKHPVINDIPAFTVFDEFYFQNTGEDIEPLMVSIDHGHAYPMVWIRSEEKGKVVNITMGHDEKVWNDKTYQKLILQSVSWLLAE